VSARVPAIEILDPGLLSTIQDRGRRHVGDLGVSPSGFADWLSARAANRLVGNQQGAALIETTMTGCSLQALEPLCVAVTGANAELAVNGALRPMWHALQIPKGAIVKLGPAQSGLRSYVAVRRGIDVPKVLASPSTDLIGGFGGLEGRALGMGDRLSLVPRRDGDEAAGEPLNLGMPRYPRWTQPAVLRVLPGQHTSMFSVEDLKVLQHQTYRVSPRSSRQGVRLEGMGLRKPEGYDVVSLGVCAGCVQLSSDGLPIILLAEHQTTGGYAVALTVISADLPDAAQLRPGDAVRFRLVSQVEAALALAEKMEFLAQPLHQSDPSYRS
jgi:antagonist of KipI